MSEPVGALSRVRILDLSDEKSIYGVKMLADLGAMTIRPEPIQGDRLRNRGPFDDQSGESLWYAYFASSRKFLQVDSRQENQVSRLQQLAARADIVVVSPDNELSELIDTDALCKRNKKLVVVRCSSFGSWGPWRDYQAPDIVAAALGGSAAVTGDADTSPLRLCNELTFCVAGAYTGIAALAGLYHVRRTGKGQIIEVPVHECIASCLEHVLMWYFHHQFFPNARAKALERRGSLHWTNLYHVMAAQNGSIMVTPTPNIDALLAWLIEEEAFDDLLDAEYQEPGGRRRYFTRFMDVLREWVSHKDVEALFFEAQERHAPFGWVHSIDRVARNPQLKARGWWQDQVVGGRTVKGPGVPFQFSQTPAHPRESSNCSLEDVDDVIQQVGWSETR